MRIVELKKHLSRVDWLHLLTSVLWGFAYASAIAASIVAIQQTTGLRLF